MVSEYLALLIREFPNQFLFVSVVLGFVSALALLIGYVKEQPE